MNSTLKKTLIISAAALAAAAVAVAAVLFILKAGSHAADARLDNPPSSSSSAVQAVSSEPPAPVDNGIRLVISSPEKSVISVTAPEFTFSGTSDREEPLTVNGTAPFVSPKTAPREEKTLYLWPRSKGWMRALKRTFNLP